MKSCKISPYPKQEGSKRPWDMYIPPQSIPCWIAPFGGISYRRGRSLLILIGKVYQNLKSENKQR